MHAQSEDHTVFESLASSDLPIWARRMRLLRIRQGLSQKELGEAIGSYQSRVWKWEKGVGAPDPTQLHALSRVLGIPMSLLGDHAAELVFPTPLPFARHRRRRGDGSREH